MLDANIAGAPVVDASGKITGVLCESDVIWKGTGKPVGGHHLRPQALCVVCCLFVLAVVG